MNARERGMFLVLCVIWGSTWIGVKAGLEAVPPLFLAGSRFTSAGVILTTIAIIREGWTMQRRDWGRMLIASVLMVTLCYGALFWGMRFVDSGTAAVLDLGLTPIALLAFALLLRDERPSATKFAAIALGLSGTLLLFGPDIWRGWSGEDTSGARLAGSAAIAASTLAYGLGSVMARPLLMRYSALLVSGTTTFLGGIVLLLGSALAEPGFGEAAQGNWGWTAWAGWAFLVLFGSLVGYSLYMVLLRDVGSSRAGMYAFVSPVVALVLGATFRSETVTALSLIGAAVMLSAAWLAIRKPGDALTGGQIQT
jgi:drug/metabolite transporter (DMT)-like permease